MNSLTQVLPKRNTQLRPNLWQTTTGAVVGYGAMLAPNGLAFCFTCGTDECSHVQQCDEAWLAGRDSQEIPFMGEPVTYDDSAEYNQEAEYGIPPAW